MSVPFVAQGTRSGQMYDIVTPTGIVHTPPPGCCWRATKARFDQLVADDMIHWPRGGNGRPRVKKFTTTTDIVPHTIWLADEVGTTDEAKREVQALFGKNRVFDTPKPERILQRIIHIATNPGDLVIDPFAGSGTTAAVAHKMGRNWVTVEVEQATIAQFVEPRLRSVVQGTDDGGASTHTVRVSDQDLPDGVSPEAARRFVTLLNKFATLPGVDLDAVADLRRRAATKETVERTWVGGGGFTLAETH